MAAPDSAQSHRVSQNQEQEVAGSNPAERTSWILIDVPSRSDEHPRSWPNVALSAGGLLMVPMWVRYTSLHGPTSFDEDGHWLGQGPGFWGSMMAPAMLLIVLGVYGQRALLVGRSRRIARLGYWLTVIGLGVPAVLDLSVREVVPPFLMPLAALGLILLAAAHRHDPALPIACRVALFAMGILLSAAFLMNAIPLETLDTFQWYRLYGIQSNVLFGLGWVIFGASLARSSAAELTPSRATEAA